jgi:hypothetical protein
MIAQRARALKTAGAVPSARWSFAQICQHLALSIEATLINAEVTIGADVTGPPARPYGPLRRRLFRFIILTLGRIPRGIPVPPGAGPREQATLDAELAHLEAAARAYEAAALEGDRVWPAQRYLGPLTAAQWRRFHHVHAAHHYAYLGNRPRLVRYVQPRVAQ